ncbi:Pex19 protein, partial [Metschnikowia bicuspidata var. bicuspidata NRRL YB-4993]
DDLDDLLDEFDEQVLSKPPGALVAESQDGLAAETDKNASATLNDEFKHNIEDLIKDLNIEDPEAKTQFEQLVKQFEESHMEEAKNAQTPQNFDNVMKDTMERLKKSGESIDEQMKKDPSAGNPEDMLTQLLAGLGDGSAGDGDLDMSKLLTDMLDQLSSKEVLYEPIRDLNAKFPEYLKENEGKISAEDHTNYTKQYEVTKEILAVFDAPGYDNNNLQHRDNVNSLLESLQELGNPPTELVGDENDFPGFGGGTGASSGLDFDSNDLPKDFENNLEEGCKQT